VAGIGHFFAWDGGCVLIGRHTARVPLHAHHALQIVFGRDARIRLRTAENEDWTEYPSAIIPSRQPHSLDATGASYAAVILLEPETNEGRALTELHLQRGIASIDDPSVTRLMGALLEGWLAQPSARSVSQAIRHIVQILTRGVQPAVVTDPRIEKAIAYINSHLDASLSLNEVAGEAYLSPSRFRHLFVEQTGMGLRPYILWRRFLNVWETLMAGESISTAAHRAGFADSAHLTRTSRRMFGLPPSAIQLLPDLRAREPGPRV
jgi:AraC-like DNA-binding protein